MPISIVTSWVPSCDLHQPTTVFPVQALSVKADTKSPAGETNSDHRYAADVSARCVKYR